MIDALLENLSETFRKLQKMTYRDYLEDAWKSRDLLQGSVQPSEQTSRLISKALVQFPESIEGCAPRWAIGHCGRIELATVISIGESRRLL
jgi:hypothetical protein